MFTDNQTFLLLRQNNEETGAIKSFWDKIQLKVQNLVAHTAMGGSPQHWTDWSDRFFTQGVLYSYRPRHDRTFGPVGKSDPHRKPSKVRCGSLD
jgi:hypothetical protein